MRRLTISWPRLRAHSLYCGLLPKLAPQKTAILCSLFGCSGGRTSLPALAASSILLWHLKISVDQCWRAGFRQQ